MLFMVIETYTQGPDPIYERFARTGRMLPEGLTYVQSWLSTDPKTTCFQLMETDDPSLFDTWIQHWDDLATFEIVQVDLSPTSAT